MSDPVPLTTHHPPSEIASFIPNELTQHVIEYQKTGNQRAKNMAAKGLMNFTRSQAAKIAGTVYDGSIDADEFYCAGWIGFLQAIEKYDIAKGYQFFAYAKPRIIGAMRDERRKRCPAFKRRKRKEGDEGGQHYRQERSLDETFDISRNGDGTEISLLDCVISTPSHLEAIIAQDEENDTWAIAIWILSLLDPRERYVLIHYYILRRTFISIADDFGRSESLICQINKRALAKINHLLYGTPMPRRIRKKSKSEHVAVVRKSPKPAKANVLCVKTFKEIANNAIQPV